MFYYLRLALKILIRCHIWAASWQNKQNGMCAQRRLRSASAQSDQSLCCPHEESLGPSLSAQLRLWSDWADAQADLSLRWANEAAHFTASDLGLHCLPRFILLDARHRWVKKLHFLAGHTLGRNQGTRRKTTFILQSFRSIKSSLRLVCINPNKPSVPFLGHMQTV